MGRRSNQRINSIRWSSESKRGQSKCHTLPSCVRVSVTENGRYNI